MIDIGTFISESLDIVYAAIVIILALIISAIFRSSVRSAAKPLKLSRDTRKSAAWVFNLILYSITAIVCFYIFGWEVGTLLAGLGIAALAIGFAAQQLLSNIIAGFIIIAGKPFRIGDFISFEGGEGWVETIGLRSTSISTYDHNMIVVPNAVLIDSALVNSTGGQNRTMISVSVAVEPRKDLEKIAENAKKIPQGIPGCIVDAKNPVILNLRPIERLGRAHWLLELLFWIDDSKKQKEITTSVSIALNKLIQK